MQILSACHQLEDLTLCGCTTCPRNYWRYTIVHPFISATAEHANAVARSATQSVGIRNLRLQWDKSQQHAYLDSGVLCDLAAVPSLEIHAASVVLCVPLPCAPVPAALKIATQHLQLCHGLQVDR